MNFRSDYARKRNLESNFHLAIMALVMGICVFVILSLQGCSNTGLAIKTGYDVANSYTQRTTNLLQADLITVDEAKKRSAILKQAKQALDTAKSAWLDCQAKAPPTTSGTAVVAPCDQAQASLDAANLLLAQVETWLITQEKGKK